MVDQLAVLVAVAAWAKVAVVLVVLEHQDKDLLVVLLDIM
jgi:hypothetical protein